MTDNGLMQDLHRRSSITLIQEKPCMQNLLDVYLVCLCALAALEKNFASDDSALPHSLQDFSLCARSAPPQGSWKAVSARDLLAISTLFLTFVSVAVKS